MGIQRRFPVVGGYTNFSREQVGRIDDARNQGAEVYAQPMVGNYQTDTPEDAYLRDVRDTVEAINYAEHRRTQELGGANGQQHVQRFYPGPTPGEIAAVQKRKAVAMAEHWDQYWRLQMDPAKPWTIHEVNKVAPEVQKKTIDALSEISQFTMDLQILKHMGHGGDPYLARLQYELDQGKLSHMPRLSYISNVEYNPGPMSIFGIRGSTVRDHGDWDNANILGLPRNAIDTNRYPTDESRYIMRGNVGADAHRTLPSWLDTFVHSARDPITQANTAHLGIPRGPNGVIPVQHQQHTAGVSFREGHYTGIPQYGPPPAP